MHCIHGDDDRVQDEPARGDALEDARVVLQAQVAHRQEGPEAAQVGEDLVVVLEAAIWMPSKLTARHSTISFPTLTAIPR